MSWNLIDEKEISHILILQAVTSLIL